MQFTIHHTTEYSFQRPVFFEPHHLRFQPRSDAAQRLISHRLEIEPTPAGSTQAFDTDGNVVTMAWFDNVHSALILRSEAVVETFRANPFDYLLTPTNRRLPIGYLPWEAAQLAPALKRAAVPIYVDPVRSMAEQIREASRSELVPFLSRLCETIHTRFKVIHREDGPPWLPAVTMEQRQGACRDLAILFMDACRSVGLAARFVSGYTEGDPFGQHDLHAWAEVYLPAAGWRGYDPTQGLAVADRHIAIAASADAQNAGPVTATYRGSNVEAYLQAEVRVEMSSTAAALITADC